MNDIKLIDKIKGHYLEQFRKIYKDIKIGLENGSIAQADYNDYYNLFWKVVPHFEEKYGQRRSKRKTEHLIRELSSNDQII